MIAPVPSITGRDFAGQCRLRIILASAIRLAVLVVAWSLLVPAAGPAFGNGSAPAEVDFAAQVWPILKERCVRCHGAEQADGELRLDNVESVRRGGHTGSEILGTVDDSELLRRLESEDPDYQMPKGEVPLSIEQVELFREWIAGGAPWDDHAIAQLEQPVESARQPVGSFLPSIDDLADLEERFRWLIIIGVLFLVSVLFIEKTRKRQADAIANSKGLMKWVTCHVGRSYHVCGTLMIVLAGFIIQNRFLRSEIDELKRPTVVQREQGGSQAYQIPEPIRPSHPPRLGGAYYRGNDERSDKLFNGGNYRTATMELQLEDSDGNRMDWGSEVNGGRIGIRLRINRAPQATTHLFRDKALTACALTKQIPGLETNQFADEPVHFEVVESGEVWEAFYPLGELQLEEETGSAELKGRLYLGPNRQKAHYGIEYSLVIRDGRINAESELWMGAIYVTSRVVVLEEGDIPIADWFGFQPIPEIVGENSTDRDLLGISEHIPGDQ